MYERRLMECQSLVPALLALFQFPDCPLSANVHVLKPAARSWNLEVSSKAT
jgi:hypothetical protein